MSFELVAYEKLKISIYDSIKSLIKSHNPKLRVRPENIEESISEIPSEERQTQARVLLKTVDLLQNSTNESEQARVLNAMVYYVREQISATYKHASPEGSKLFCSLTTSLGINKDNEPGRNDLSDMYDSLVKFLYEHVYVEGDARKGYLDKQPFAIQGYSVEKELETLVEKSKTLQIEIIKAAKHLNAQQHKSGKHHSGILSSLWGSSSKSDKPAKDSEQKSSLVV
jgi:hypothetical protein